MKKTATAITCRKSANRFPDFKCVALEDRDIIAGYARDFGLTSCEYSFANLYSWKDVHQRSWSLYRDRLLILDITNDALFLPAGKSMGANDLAALSRELKRRGMSGSVTMVPEVFVENHPELAKHYRIEKQRHAADYIYAVEKLTSLKGRKLQKKKNLISQFRRSWPGHTVVPVAGEIKTACRKLAQDLLARNLKISRSISEEQTALGRALMDFESIGFEGLALIAAGKLAAFSIFSRLNDDMYDIHFEKSDPAFKGAAQMINYETAAHLAPQCRFVNREQDLGIEGLRQAKRSYDPERIESPYKLSYRL
ncbi:MAG: DUF2156 domain-containing protein [Desulfobacterales bacterium]|nr:DUF2156 domain-containing protein [Desulfobacterales bacterium]